MSTTPLSPQADPPTGQADARWRRSTAIRALIAGLATICYLGLLALAILVAAADTHFALPMIVAGGAGTAASAGLLIANLAMRSNQRVTAASRWLTGASVVLVAVAALGLVGLAVFQIATNDVTTALLAVGFVVPLLGVAVPAIPTLTAAFRR